MTVPENILPNLIRIKEIHTRGKMAQREKTDIGNMVACHHYDIAVEFLLRTLCTHYSIRLEKMTNFETIWNKVDDKYKSTTNFELPLKNQIMQMREGRNAVQHSGIPPHDDALEQYRSNSESFLSDVVFKLFSIDNLSELHYRELIKDSELKEGILSAQEEGKKGNFQPMLDKLFAIFLKAIEKSIEKVIPQEDLRPYSKIPSQLYTYFNLQQAGVLTREIGEIKHLAILVSLGTNLSQYYRFWAVVNSVIETDEKKKVPLTKDAVQFCEDFVISEIVRWGL